jgi:DNA-binding transcriptional LysR family regulator
MLDARRLKYFKSVADCGSIAAASRKLNIAQPALSGHISKLEEAYGVTLFVRFSRGVTLTREGERLLVHATEILAAFERADLELRRLGRGVARRRPVRLGLLPSWGSGLALALIAVAEERLPDVALQIIELRSDDAKRALDRNELDFAVMLDETHLEHFEPIVREPLLFVSRNAGDETIRFADLAAQRLILPTAANPLRKLIDAAAATIDVKLRPILEVEGLDTIKSAVKAGIGSSIMSWVSVRDEHAEGLLHARRICAPDLIRQVYLGWGKGAAPAMADSMLQILRNLAVRSGGEPPTFAGRRPDGRGDG